MKKVLPAKRLVPVAALSLLAAIALATGGGCRRSSSTDTTLRLSGNIESTDAQLGFKIPGRVAERFVSEGERVTAGQLVARLDDTEQREQVALRRAELAAAEATLADLVAGSRPQELATARAALRSAEADRDRARLELTRQQELRRRDVTAARDLESAEANHAVAAARAEQTAEALKLAEEGPRRDAVAAARARVEIARASLALAETQLENTRLLAPFAGIVLSHNIEPGEFVSAGTPVITAADLAHVWVRAYVNQTDLGRVRHGQPAEVCTDTFPGKTYNGTVGFISSEAEFTPKTVQTEKERVKLVFRVKIDLENPADELKPGMPADATLP
ncbi:MAG TPA: HlyD family efflux transporter periplasmic adaptor subunit [Opitutaceae bacterium]|nr:HlyD family efflux transporter periplasmic adaptor subunit [Opitutaceae bacterium]